MTLQGAIRVVLVDDSPELRLLLRELLRARGVAVVGEAGDGREALATLEVTPCDLVVMDLQMPVMDGAEATERIRERHPQVEVVAFSALADEESARRMLRAGAARHFSKTDYTALVEHVAASVARAA